MSAPDPMSNPTAAVTTLAVASDPRRWCQVAASADGVRFAIMSDQGCEAQVTLTDAQAALLAQTLQGTGTHLAAE